MNKIGLNKKEKEEAKHWRINKCSYDGFGMLFLKFQNDMREKVKLKNAN